jgi:hypothetical protein
VTISTTPRYFFYVIANVLLENIKWFITIKIDCALFFHHEMAHKITQIDFLRNKYNLRYNLLLLIYFLIFLLMLVSGLICAHLN